MIMTLNFTGLEADSLKQVNGYVSKQEILQEDFTWNALLFNHIHQPFKSKDVPQCPKSEQRGSGKGELKLTSNGCVRININHFYFL